MLTEDSSEDTENHFQGPSFACLNTLFSSRWFARIICRMDKRIGRNKRAHNSDWMKNKIKTVSRFVYCALFATYRMAFCLHGSASNFFSSGRRCERIKLRDFSLLFVINWSTYWLGSVAMNQRNDGRALISVKWARRSILIANWTSLVLDL